MKLNKIDSPDRISNLVWGTSNISDSIIKVNDYFKEKWIFIEEARRKIQDTPYTSILTFDGNQQLIDLLPKIPTSNTQSLLQEVRCATISVSHFNALSVLNSIKVTDPSNSIFIRNWGIEQNYLQTFSKEKFHEDIYKIKNPLALSIQEGILSTSQFTIFAEQSLNSITQYNIGNLCNISYTNKEKLHYSCLDFLKSYNSLISSFIDTPDSFIKLGSTITSSISMELYSTSHLIKSISIKENQSKDKEKIHNEIIDTNNASLTELLPKLDGGLYTMWIGASESIVKKQHDWARHFVISLRELLTHVIHLLAPDADIKKWNSAPEFYVNGKPTRRARLSYIYRNFNNSKFENFIKKDIDATVEFFNVLNSGTHTIDFCLSDEQAMSLKIKAEGLLKLILTTSLHH